MERVVFVEVLGRRGDVAQRMRLAQFPATIGRAWTNDVILTDPHVDAQHARLFVDELGELTIEDLGSVNGLFADGTTARVDRLLLRGLATVRLGRTSLRVVAADQAVPPAVPDVQPSGRLERALTSGRDVAIVNVAGIALMALVLWLGEYRGASTADLVGDLLGIVVAMAIWAGIWALAGRLIAHRARFLAHATVAWLFVFAFGAWMFVQTWIDFLLPEQSILGFVDWWAGTLLFVAFIATHAGLASNASRLRRVTIGAALAGGLALLVWIGEQASEDNYGNVTVSDALKPVPASMVPATTVASFLERAGDLKTKVDALDE
jgi:pSer/pThr/pTyr-binding forkhead associated (FHA) protein